MTSSIPTRSVHHVFLTVGDVQRSVAFYAELFGFQKMATLGGRVLLSNGTVILALGPSPDPARAVPGDRFDENRVGLDHLCLGVAHRRDLEAAERLLTERGVAHGNIEDIADFKVSVLMLRDPDNIQMELVAPLEQ